MKFFSQKFKFHIGRIGAAAAVFGAAGLVLAYHLGYYDLSFLDRPSSLDEMLDDSQQSSGNPPPFILETDKSTISVPKETEAPAKETAAEDKTPSADDASTVSSVVSVYDTLSLPDTLWEIPLVSSLADYAPVESAYQTDRTILAKMQFSFKLPSDFSLSQRVGTRLRYEVPEEYAPYEAKYVSVTEDRPAIELYMGMILIDTGKTIVIADENGTPLCSFDGSVYKPAYTRDKEGRPLFKKEKENGRIIYYHLSEDGKNFIVSSYNDKTDSRGLYFDYPKDWGTSNDIVFKEYSTEEKKWAYRTQYAYVSGYNFDEAYAFSEGLACVTSPTEDNRGGMYFINQYGWPVQQTFVTYLSDLDRHFIWDYALPASRGIENIGFFYFDHGLTRVRYQIIDYYNWVNKERVRVVSDEDKLIRTDGSIYELPQGYALKGYSEGMILLQRNGLYGFMDYTGDWIAEPCYASATPFIDGLSVLETADGRFGMIDSKGNIVLPFTYDRISMVSSGLVAVYRAENGWSILKLMEKSE